MENEAALSERAQRLGDTGTRALLKSAEAQVTTDAAAALSERAQRLGDTGVASVAATLASLEVRVAALERARKLEISGVTTVGTAEDRVVDASGLREFLERRETTPQYPVLPMPGATGWSWLPPPNDEAAAAATAR